MKFFKKSFKGKKEDILNSNIPIHIAIVMDGNGRWAKKRGLPRNLGHREGAKALEKVCNACGDIGVKYLTVYAFSTENWNRPKSEVDAIMNLIMDYLKNAEKHLGGKNVSIRIIGNVSRLSTEMQQEIKRVTKITGNNTGLVLNIALNYGSRDEIVSSIKEIIKDVNSGKINIENINEDTVSKRLYTAQYPDPDLLIRPGGEKRISNYLLWQLAYAEFYFTDVLWPDFDEGEVLEAVKVYQQRNRRFGGV